jgi:DNA-binding response OmpR family regulator
MAQGKNGKRVLAIDDDGLALDIYRSILEEEGFEVVGARDGKSGIGLFRSQKFDCVILDIYMPGVSGLDVLEELDPETTRVPVIAISGSDKDSGSHSLHLASTLGAVRSFRKDFEHSELVKAVRELTGV